MAHDHVTANCGKRHAAKSRDQMGSSKPRLAASSGRHRIPFCRSELELRSDGWQGGGGQGSRGGKAMGEEAGEVARARPCGIGRVSLRILLPIPRAMPSCGKADAGQGHHDICILGRALRLRQRNERGGRA